VTLKRGFAGALIAAGTLAGMAQSAEACLCATGFFPQRAIDGAPVIFSGRVTSVEHGVPDGRPQSLTATLDVVERWKGTVADRVTVYGSTSGASCGYSRFPIGEVITLLAYLLPPQPSPWPDLKTDFCTMSAMIQQPAAVIHMLQELRNKREAATNAAAGH
jgi:hypothetical protein